MTRTPGESHRRSGVRPAEQKNSLAKLILTAVDSLEDLHLPRTILHTESAVDLIPANKCLSDAAARLQVMQMSQYKAAGEAERPSEKILAEIVESLKPDCDYIVIDCGLKHKLLEGWNTASTGDTFWINPDLHSGYLQTCMLRKPHYSTDIANER